MPETEPTTLVTLAALDTLMTRLQETGTAYHYAPTTASRRAAFKETNRVVIALEERMGVPVFFDRMSGNQFEIWIEGRF